jgi:hypothetical protein
MLCHTYSSLHVRVRVVEVLQVLFAIDPGRHRRDIESEESTADGAESGERVDVGNLIHGGDGVEQCSCFSDPRDHKTKSRENCRLEPRSKRLQRPGRKRKTNTTLNTFQITDMSSHERIRYSTTVY